MRFDLLGIDGLTNARAGTITTVRGEIHTPIFMPVGTVASVKGISPRMLRDDVGAQVILCNAYHLFLRPGIETLRKAKGLHAFMAWSGPILTDSGGYQVFSLAANRTISDDGVSFQSHIDGTAHAFTPESVIEIQRGIGADIMMVLDECPAGDAPKSYALEANHRTIRWAARCKQRFDETTPLYAATQVLFGIVQGVVYPEVRRDSALALVDMDFPGYAIGGLSVGEPDDVMYEIVDVVNDVLPREKPRYLMGVGTPANLLENIARGVDMFDCVMPTRNGRNGMLFTTEGIVNIRNAKWQHDFHPVDDGLDGYCSQSFTRAYLRHLFLSNEILALHIASVQNLSFYRWLMAEARRAILGKRFEAWRREIQPRVSRRL
jgi:queuine tRNA-ribosyltransferase